MLIDVDGDRQLSKQKPTKKEQVQEDEIANQQSAEAEQVFDIVAEK